MIHRTIGVSTGKPTFLKYIYCTLSVLFLGLFSSACPVMDAKSGIVVSGKIILDARIVGMKLSVVSVWVYTKEGEFLGNVTPYGREDSYILWEMEIFAKPGIPVTFWTQISVGADITDIYFDEGHDDIITEETPYDWTAHTFKVPIFSENDLKNISILEVDSGVDIDDFVLISDINLTGFWKPLFEAPNNPFKGTFDGKSHTISGLRLQDGSGNIGFFASIEGTTSDRAEIKNLNIVLENTDLDLNLESVQNFGIAVGHAKNVLIDKVLIRGKDSITIRKKSGREINVGGVAGVIEGGSVISRSTSAISLIIESGASEISAGGIVGKFEGITTNPYYTDRSNVFSCYYAPTLHSISVHGVSSNVYIGGIAGAASVGSIGMSNLLFEECYNAANISTTGATNGRAGSIIGGITGSTGISNLKFVRSVAINKTLDVSYSSPQGINRIAGDTSTEEYTYAADDISGTTAVAGTPGVNKARRDIQGTFFSGDSATGSLNWNFNETWDWNHHTLAPIFKWY